MLFLGLTDCGFGCCGDCLGVSILDVRGRAGDCVGVGVHAGVGFLFGAAKSSVSGHPAGRVLVVEGGCGVVKLRIVCV